MTDIDVAALGLHILKVTYNSTNEYSAFLSPLVLFLKISS